MNEKEENIFIHEKPSLHSSFYPIKASLALSTFFLCIDSRSYVKSVLKLLFCPFLSLRVTPNQRAMRNEKRKKMGGAK